MLLKRKKRQKGIIRRQETITLSKLFVDIIEMLERLLTRRCPQSIYPLLLLLRRQTAATATAESKRETAMPSHALPAAAGAAAAKETHLCCLSIQNPPGNRVSSGMNDGEAVRPQGPCIWDRLHEATFKKHETPRLRISLHTNPKP